jgi:cellulose biosynthesis protein BcsQ
VPTSQDQRIPRLALVNHKGGVGKTTLGVNLACALGELGKRILVVDSDPQCNLTSYLVEETVVDDLLDKSDSDSGTTLWSSMAPLVDGSGKAKRIRPIDLPGNVFLLPGDIRLAEFESELGSFWADCFQRKARGFRGTTALSELVNYAAKKCEADFVIYDTGPNIGPLNRVIMLDCDYFAIPVASDTFSLRAVRTLGHAIATWITDWDTISQLAPDSTYLLPGRPKPLGYIPQRFKTYGGVPAQAYERALPLIEKALRADVLTLLSRIDADLTSVARSPLRLADIKDFGSLANAAQREGVAIWNTTQAGTPDQKLEARTAFRRLAERILHRIGSDGAT